MKSELPIGPFGRILLGGWAVFFVGILLFFLFALLIPGRFAGHLITPLLILGIFVVLGTSTYIASYGARRLSYYLGRAWRRRDGSQTAVPLRPVERVLAAGWLLFVVAALGGLLFSREKWVLTYGPQVLFSLFCVVVASSMMYGSYLLLRQVMKHLRRG
jgi:hypothetical protein